jgi:HEPN domain-containing protein
MENRNSLSAREWLIKAKHDLMAARRLTRDQEPLLDVAVYHCQQAAEKAVKGFLTFQGVTFEKTHDIRLIVLKSAEIEGSFEKLLDDAMFLTPYAHAFRYPDGVMMPSISQCEQALAAAERIYSFVLSKYPEIDPDAG